MTTDKALDILSDLIDNLLLSGHFSTIDIILDNIPIEQLPIDILLGILTTTLPAKSLLRSRHRFYKNVEKTLNYRDLEKLLEGLA